MSGDSLQLGLVLVNGLALRAASIGAVPPPATPSKAELHIIAVYCVPAHLAHGPVTAWLPSLGPTARQPHSRLLRHVSKRRACIPTSRPACAS